MRVLIGEVAMRIGKLRSSGGELIEERAYCFESCFLNVAERRSKGRAGLQ